MITNSFTEKSEFMRSIDFAKDKDFERIPKKKIAIK